MPKQMPKILDCSINDCAYNVQNMCHAMAITVGDSDPICDTYIHETSKAGIRDITGGVGACKVSSCRFNDSLECSADGIHVGPVSNHAMCNTFSPQ